MVNLPAILVANVSAVTTLVILLFSSKKSTKNRLPDNILFFTMVYSAIFQAIIETLAFLFDGNTAWGMHELLLLLNSLSYVNNIFFAFTWILYADYKLFSDLKRIRKRYSYIVFPAVLITIGSIINLFTPVFFRISDANVYSRTALYMIPFAVTYLYLAFGVVMIYRYRGRRNKYMFLPAILFMVPILIGSILQFFFYGLSLVWIGTAIALVSMYINVQNEVSYVDPLSGMYTRQYMNSFLDSEARKSGQKKILAGIMLDIDRFKNINDTFGHLTGDDAIRSAGTMLHSCVPSNGFIARFAGDEFVIVLLVDDESEVTSLMKLIRKKTAEFNVTANKPYFICFSMGYSIYSRHNDTIDGFISRMDIAMYNDKAKKNYYDTSVPDRRYDRK